MCSAECALLIRQGQPFPPRLSSSPLGGDGFSEGGECAVSFCAGESSGTVDSECGGGLTQTHAAAAGEQGERGSRQSGKAPAAGPGEEERRADRS